ncbi:MAG: hypothetical protein ACFFHD_02230 [Promethearchaeota archaeon]
MGFKRINQDELETEMGPNFLGMPIRQTKKVIETSKRDKKVRKSQIGSISEILIANEEFLDYQYQYDKTRKSITGYGNIIIFNNSLRDRIWDAFLQLSGTQFEDKTSEKGTNLGIFEPNSNKILKYEIVNSEMLPDLIKIDENIENLNDDIKSFEDLVEDSNYIDIEINNTNSQKNHILLIGKENKIRFSILIENISTTFLEKIKIKKYISKFFYDLEVDGAINKDFTIGNNVIEFSINNLNPGEKREISIIGNIYPKKKENINTGKIELSLNLNNQILTEVDIKNFSAYSHAMHAIRKTEKEDAPNHWNCSFIFENHSEFKLQLKSILVLDKDKKNTLLDLNLNNSGEKLILNPHENYKAHNFDYIDEKEPIFSRKVEYSVEYKIEKNCLITAHYDDSVFKVVNLMIKKELSEKEIKSYEQSEIDTKIIVKNMGTVPIKGILAQEKIPKDFLPTKEISDYKLSNSSGEIKFEDFIINISPDDDDPTHEHILELRINLNNNKRPLINVDDLLEIKHSLKAMTPDHNKDYNFPLDIQTYYPKYFDSKQNQYYVTNNTLSKIDGSEIKITHKRRKLMIGKEIFPGRNSNEFAIYITAKNDSNIKLNNVDVTDAFPDSFELISSNIDHKLSKADKAGERKISFTIDTLLPYQEREIMYYLRNITGKDIEFSELESFFVG